MVGEAAERLVLVCNSAANVTMPHQRLNGLILLAATAACGCQSALWMHPVGSELAQEEPIREGSLVRDNRHAESAPDEKPVRRTAFTAVSEKAVSSPPMAKTTSTDKGDDATAPDAVLTELQVIGAADPIAAQQLVQRLQTVKPSLRPLVAQQFRASWQLHREVTGQLPADQPAATQHNILPALHGQQPPTDADKLQRGVNGVFDPSAYNPADFAALNKIVSATREPAELESSDHATQPPTEEPRSAVASLAVKRTASASALPEAMERRADVAVMPASYEGQPAGANALARQQGWADNLQQAISQLKEKAAHDPRTTEEAYRHVRLRLMQLAAGEKMEALEPVPGLTPTEQAYWSNQLFTIATLLDHNDVSDDSLRASLAGDQLGAASAKLGELSALSVRNLAFCSEVYGFGDCEPKKPAKFKLGEEVMLYAEIENFRSESTEKGHHASLATSYEVLDKHGNRVEEGEFATVDDYCNRTRRDFYIEYTFTLPKRIYPNQYQLKLVIRDRLSGKIGHAIVDFEITE